MRIVSVALCICTLLSFKIQAQTVYLADTAFTTDVGAGGAPASCIAPHVRYLGWQMGRTQDTWLADVFTVPAGSAWAFDTVIVYGVQKNSGTTSTFTGCNLMIYEGTPGGLENSVIWGDTSTNVLAGTGFTGIYKVDTFSSDGGLNDVSYPIMYLTLYLSPAPHLSAGTYWLSWSSTGSAAAIPFSPDKVLPGRVNPSGQMAKEFFAGNWHNIIDSGDAIGMDKIIKGSAGLLATPVISNQASHILSGNTPNPFSGTTDISYYLSETGYAKLSVYNILGQLVSTVAEGTMVQGWHSETFNAGNLPAGTYYYRLSSSSGADSKPMILIR